MKRILATLAVGCLATFGCSGKTTSPFSDGGSGDLATPGDAASSACGPPTTYGGGEMSVANPSAIARIVDETGTAAASQPAFVCGLNLCSAVATTGVDGSVSIQTNLTEKKPAFKYGDAIAYANFAIPLAMANMDFTTGGALLATGKLSDKTGAPLTAGTAATSGDVTLTLPANDVVAIDTLLYATTDSQKLRTVNIPLTNTAPIFASAAHPDFALLYGVAPAESTVCPPGAVTVALTHTTMSPNDEGWAPGTAVEFWVTTTDTAQTFAPYGGWAKISDGTVSGDGMSVTTTAGQGFNVLENFAIRKAN